MGDELSSGSGSTAYWLPVAETIALMAKLSKAQRERNQIERLQQQLIILDSKVNLLLQAKETIIAKLAAYQK